MTDGDSDADGVSRRDVLAAAGLAVTGAAGAGAALRQTQQSTDAAAVGQLGASGSPLSAAYVRELRGPIVDTGGSIDGLVNIRVEGDSANLGSVNQDTLVIRYDDS